MASQELADRMRQIREKLGVSQKTMSSKLDLGATTWQNYERGLNLPNGDTLLRLRQEGFNPTWVLTGEGPMMAGSQITDFDKELFRDCFAAVYEVVEELGKKSSPETLIDIAFQVYDMELEEARRGNGGVAAARILRLVKAAI